MNKINGKIYYKEKLSEISDSVSRCICFSEIISLK